MGIVAPLVVAFLDFIFGLFFRNLKPTMFNPGVIFPIMALTGIHLSKVIPDKSEIAPILNKAWVVVITCYVVSIIFAVTPLRLFVFGITTFAMMWAITIVGKAIQRQKDQKA